MAGDRKIPKLVHLDDKCEVCGKDAHTSALYLGKKRLCPEHRAAPKNPFSNSSFDRWDGAHRGGSFNSDDD